VRFKPPVKVGCTVKRRVGALGDEQVVGTVDPRFELISGLTGLKRRTGVFRIMPDQNDELFAFSPVGEQSTHIIFAIGVVAGTKRWVVETVLDINHYQGIEHDTTVLRRHDQKFGKVSLTSFHREILG
jgi:hypothetical protein